ncbi:MAG: hypothetical protein R2745_21490 [Vicinamibacterales bacterium]
MPAPVPVGQQRSAPRAAAWQTLFDAVAALSRRYERLCAAYGGPLLLLALAAFAASRVFVWSLMVPGDVPYYARYAYEARVAHQQGATIYEHFYPPDTWPKTVEYPPLAVDLLALVGRLVPPAVDPDDFTRSFSTAFHTLIFGLDLVTLAAVVAYRLRRRTPLSAVVAGVVTYTLAGLVLKNFLYSRLDVLLGQLLALALVLMIAPGRRTLVSSAVLSVAVAFKLVPVLLIPIWLVGALHATPASLAALTRELARKGAAMAAVVLLPWVVFGLRLGEDAISFLRIHAARGIHIESSWGTVTVLLSKVGLPVSVELFRSYDVESSLSSSFAALAPAVLAGGCALIYGLYFRQARRMAPAPGIDGGSVAQRDPELFKLAMLATVVFSLAASTVLSPQYLLWLLPLGLLMPWGLSHGRSWGLVSHPVLLILAFLTALIVPKFYTSDVLRLTWFGTTLLTLRNAGIVLYAALLIAYLARYRRMSPAEPPLRPLES